MTDENQILIPQSFIALYLDPGRSRPRAAHEVIAARYELCEDMACLLCAPAQAMADDTATGESEVLRRCQRGLIDDASTFSADEAAWVIRRLAELLNWPPLADQQDDAGN